MDEKKLTKLAELKRITTVENNIIINGIPQPQQVQQFALTCPSCNNILGTFDPRLPETMIIEEISAKDDNQDLQITYCPKCGQKVQMLRPKIIDNIEE